MDVSSQLCGAAVAIVLALGGAGLSALVAQQVVASVTALVVLAVCARWAPGLPRRADGLAAHFSFGAATVGTQVLRTGARTSTRS